MQRVVPQVLFRCLVIPLLATPKQMKQPGLWQSWSEVKTKAAANKQPIFIDMYTDWCVYCKVMDATTYRNDSIVAYLKKHYQRFKFNPEKKDTLEWQQKLYTFNSRFGVHDFAVYLTKGSIVYPTTIIIAPGGQPYYKHGAIKPGEMEMLLKYFAEVNKDSITLEAYSKSFSAKWSKS